SQHNKIIYTYDKLLRPAKKIYRENKGDKTLIEQQIYDSFSRVVKKVYGSGMIRIFSYNPWGQVEMAKDSMNGKPLHDESFVYDADGNIIRLQRSDGENRQAIIHYRYDHMDNLVSMDCEGNNDLCPHDTTFSGKNLKTAPAIIQQNYKFTPLNRIAGVTEKLIDNSSPQWHSLSKTMYYVYANTKVPLRLTAINTKWNNQPYETHRFVYDVSGNMTIDGEGNKISYNLFNQIIKVINSTGMVSHYNYNGQGKEVEIVTEKGTRQMIYQGGKLNGEIVTDAANHLYRMSYPSAEIKTTDGMITSWNESNYKGDVIGILTQDKTSKQWSVQQHNVYSPYGMVWSYGKQKTTILYFQQTLKGFDGEITDAATGWQFLGDGHRTYNPSQRYFFSEDPDGDGYAFGSNNPIMKSDPSGNMPKWLGKVFSLANTVFSLGMSRAHNKFVLGIGRSLLWGAMAIPFGPTAIGLAFAAPATLTFASTVKPANKGLQQASMITGSVYAGALFVAGLIAIGAGIGSVAEGLLAGAGAGELEGSEEATVVITGAEVENEISTSIQNESELAESNASATANDNNDYVENVPGGERVVFGCGISKTLPCYHKYVDILTVSQEIAQLPNRWISLNNIEGAIEKIGVNVFDEILQEYSRDDYLQLAYISLRPGGRLFVMMNRTGGGEAWMSNYAAKGAQIFGEDNIDYVEDLRDIDKISERFGSDGINSWTYDKMLVFIKPVKCTTL
ncbi:MAG: hypothetical protein OXC48_08960, partial [Endozoicomonadaceae bacterium]|nr:hypothetical protein [Endozoicomonadaceae bacterium]